MTRFGEAATATRAKEGGGGTVAYRAPETFSNANVLASAVYAFGIRARNVRRLHGHRRCRRSALLSIGGATGS